MYDSLAVISLRELVEQPDRLQVLLESRRLEFGIVAPQIVLGRRELWMPKALASRTVTRQELTKLLRYAEEMGWQPRADIPEAWKSIFETAKAKARVAGRVLVDEKSELHDRPSLATSDLGASATSSAVGS